MLVLENADQIWKVQTLFRKCRPSLEKCKPGLRQDFRECRPSLMVVQSYRKCRPDYISYRKCRPDLIKLQTLSAAALGECRPGLRKCRPSLTKYRPKSENTDHADLKECRLSFILVLDSADQVQKIQTKFMSVVESADRELIHLKVRDLRNEQVHNKAAKQLLQLLVGAHGARPQNS